MAYGMPPKPGNVVPQNGKLANAPELSGLLLRTGQWLVSDIASSLAALGSGDPSEKTPGSCTFNTNSDSFIVYERRTI